jgi:hypothetical protein
MPTDIDFEQPSAERSASVSVHAYALVAQGLSWVYQGEFRYDVRHGSGQVRRAAQMHHEHVNCSQHSIHVFSLQHLD